VSEFILLCVGVFLQGGGWWLWHRHGAWPREQQLEAEERDSENPLVRAYAPAKAEIRRRALQMSLRYGLAVVCVPPVARFVVPGLPWWVGVVWLLAGVIGLTAAINHLHTLPRLRELQR